jgi:hypothetical protein
MTENTWSALIQSGLGGLVIIVVIIFINYMRGLNTAQAEERASQAAERESMMNFIAEQREANNCTQIKTAELARDSVLTVTRETNASYTPLVEAVKGLTTEIRQLKEQNIEHATETKAVLQGISLGKKENYNKGVDKPD